VSQEDRSLAGGRQSGIIHATGEYVTFLDADDLVVPEAYEKMLKCAETQHVDIVEIDGILQKETRTFLLLGNIPTSDIMKTVHKIDELEEVKISSVDLNIGNNLQESVCKVVIETTENKLLEATTLIQEIADNDNLVLIKEI
jgi:ACT domain-containing protein